MNNSSSSKKHSPDQPETSGPTFKSQRTKMDTEKKVMVSLCFDSNFDDYPFPKSPKY